MKTLITILICLFISKTGISQIDSLSNKEDEYLKAFIINKKTKKEVKKFKFFSKKDIAPLTGLTVAGFATRVREEVLYRPNQLFRQFPNLNRRYWDIRIQDEPGFMNTEWDADHTFKSLTVASFVFVVVIKFGEKKTLKEYAADTVKSAGAYKVGWVIGNNILFKDKL